MRPPPQRLRSSRLGSSDPTAGVSIGDFRQCTHRRVGAYCQLTRGWRLDAQGQQRSAHPLELNGLETRIPTRPICPNCPKSLAHLDIRLPASWSFTPYPIAREAVQFCAPRLRTITEDTRHFPTGEWLCSRPGFNTRRILSCVLREQEAPISRGNLGMAQYKLKILNNLRLRGGGNRERTILHRRISFSNSNLGPNWSLPVIWPEASNECIGDKAPN